MTTETPPAGTELSAAALRFPINAIFLPEFVSTVMISVPVSLVFLAHPVAGGRRALAGNPHVLVAMTIYAALAAALIALTVVYRVAYRGVVFRREAGGEVCLDAGALSASVSELEVYEERLGRFFGRRARRLTIADHRGETAIVSEAVVRYDRLKDVLSELLGREPRCDPAIDARQLARTRAAWRDRHRLFPPPQDFGRSVERLLWRLVCLVPVGAIDVLVNLTVMFSLAGLGKLHLMVYAAPLSLCASAFIARYVYFYLFTSTVMNRPLGERRAL